MSEPMPSRLHEIAKLLRETQHLGPEAQRALAAVADELADALDKNAVPSAESPQLADGTKHLIELLHEKASASRLTAARDRLEQTVLAAGAGSPFLAGVARRVLEALAGLGI